MPDIDPAALSRPSISISTPALSTKSLNGPAPKPTLKLGPTVPARMDLEPIYTQLKTQIGKDQWLFYKQTLDDFLHGSLNQSEYVGRIDNILADGTGEKLHLHNELLAALYTNLTRESPPEPGPAPWVSQNDKPVPVLGPKPGDGDTSKKRIKEQVMLLPSRDRRRIKDIRNNDVDPFESLASAFTAHARPRISRGPGDASATGGVDKKNLDLEIKKRYTHPLSIESGEFPTRESIEARMLPLCYEAELTGGHSPDAAVLVSVASQVFIKEMLTGIFSRVRSNGPGDSGPTGFGVGANWIQTRRYKQQLQREEDQAQRGEVSRDKSGLLPVEAKAAHERQPLAMADVRVALEIADCGIQNFPALSLGIGHAYKDGELEHYNEYTTLSTDTWTMERGEPLSQASRSHGGVMTNGTGVPQLVNGVAPHPDAMDIDVPEVANPWEGAAQDDYNILDDTLDSILVGD